MSIGLYDIVEDHNVNAVIKKMAERSIVGLKKYGVTTERIDLKTIDWINHAQEEAMDFIIYLERLKSDLSRQEPKKEGE